MEFPYSRDGDVDVILRDGTTLRLRPPVGSDVGALVDFFSALSPDSLAARFHGFFGVDERFCRTLVEPDWRERGALVGVLGEPGSERIVALGNYVRLRDERIAESAFVVADTMQRRGVGTRLLEQLAARAGAAGIEAFVAEVRPGNSAMLSVFQNVGFRITRVLSGGVYEVQFPIKTTSGYRERVDERDHVAVRASLEPFFHPRAVAVLGASARRGSIGGELFRNVIAGDFGGTAYPVNLRGEPVAGVRGYASIDEIPGAVDLAVICVPGDRVVETSETALRSGVRALCVISAGFAEIGPEGRARQEHLLALVRAHGARLVGPNCLGLSSAGVRLNATFAPRAFPAGRIAFSSQSGALGLALLERTDARALGFSAFVSIGNKADVSTNDLLEWWENDDGTDLVLLYVESFGNPRKFARIARRVARRKPILAMKSGRSRAGTRAAGSHTAALAGSDAAVDALFRQAGVLRVETLGELVDAAALLSAQPPPRGNRVAVLTNAGGLGILCADACEAAGLELPALTPETCSALAGVLPPEASVTNPVDMLGSATADAYRASLPLVLQDPGVDAAIVLFVPPVAVRTEDVGAAISDAVLEAAEGEKPVLASIVAAEGAPATLRRSSQVPAFAYPEAAARALGRAAERAAWLRRSAGSVPPLDDVDAERARAIVQEVLHGDDDRWLPSSATRALLEAYGIPLVAETLAAGPGQAMAAAEQLGFPVVVKTATPGAHKTESGGVALDLSTQAEVRAAAARIGGHVLVQPMVTGGVELLAGVVQDPVFGPLVAFGPGGVQAELIGGAQFRLAPLTDVDARELVETGKAGTLVHGFRHARPADAGSLVDLLHRLSQLADDVPELAELDLNPVLGLPDRAVVVDARVRVARQAQSPSLKGW